MSREQETRQTSTTGGVVGFVINTIFLLILSLIVSVIVEWLGLRFNWWEYGSEHSLEMMRTELGYANSTLRQEFISEDGKSWVSVTMRYYMSAMHTLFYWCSQLASYISSDAASVNIYMDSAYNISLVFGLRVFLIIYALPLFIMVLIWGFVDGLTERDLRRFGAGRESSTIFEASRKMAFPFLVIPFVIYLSYPTSVNPMFIIAPSAVVQALIYRVLFSKYKKYL